MPNKKTSKSSDNNAGTSLTSPRTSARLAPAAGRPYQTPQPPKTPDRKRSTPASRTHAEMDSKARKLHFSIPDSTNEDDTPDLPVVTFPNLRDSTAVQEFWSAAELKSMLVAVGEASTGSKAQLASRIVRHACVSDPDFLSLHHEPALSDLQVAFVLQDMELTLSPDHLGRRNQLRELLDPKTKPDSARAPVVTSSQAQPTGKAVGSMGTNTRAAPSGNTRTRGAGFSIDSSAVTPPATAFGSRRAEITAESASSDALKHTDALLKRLESLDKILVNLEKRATAAERASLASDDATHDVLDDDDDDDVHESAPPPRRAGRPSSSGSGSLEEGLAHFTASLSTALSEGFASISGGTTADNTAMAAKLERTHPAMVDPRKHSSDPHKYGLLIKRMIVVDYKEAGITAITWKRSCKQQAAVIHGLVHAGTSSSDYNEGEALFVTFVNECITLAVEYDKDAAKYATLRTRQLGWWNESFNDMKTALRESSRYMKSPAIAFRLQMDDIISTALDVGMSNAQIKNLQTTFKLRTGFGGGFNSDPDDDDDLHRGGASRPRSFMAAPPQGSRRGQASPVDRNDRKGQRDKRENLRHVHDAGKATGERMPIAAAIIGASTHGAQVIDKECAECGITGHRKFECPRKFYAEWPGRGMPGFSRDGSRVPSSWDGDDITAATKKQWLRMISLGFFTQPPYRKDPARMPDMRQ
jgi:hypothetical protein